MEKFISNLVKHFEKRPGEPPGVLETVALAATVYAGGGPAQAQTTSDSDHRRQHISYTCPGLLPRRADFLQSVFRPHEYARQG